MMIANNRGAFVDIFNPQDIELAIKAGTPFKTAATSLSINPTEFLSKRDCQTIAASIIANPQITCFTINSVQRIDNNGWSILMNALNRTNIAQLTISSVGLYNNGMSELGHMLKNNKKITHMYLLQIRTNDYSELGEALSENTSLKSLFIRMSYRRQFNLGLDLIEKGLRSNTALERLKISYITRSAFEAICRALQTHPKIEALEFQEAVESLSPECCVVLRSLLETNKSLVKLSLERCNVNQDATTAICEGLIGNSTIRELLLDGNNLNASACSTLAHVLKHNTALKRLSLNNNLVGQGEGMADICKALLENNTLEWLDVRANVLTGEFYSVLKQVIGQTTSLTRLDIDDETFAFTGALKLLTPQLRLNKSLQIVSFCTIADDAMASAWCSILEENESLINIGAIGKAVSTPLQFQIAEHLARNRQQQNTSVQNVIVTLFNIARDPHSLNHLPLELWFHVSQSIRIPGVAIDWHDVFGKMFENKSQLKVLHQKYL